MSKGLEDLKFHLLINKTEYEFIISDHPVTQYNWLYRDLEHPGISSWMAKGIQFYLPISSSLCLCVYDSTSYKFGTKKSTISEINNISDIDWLNDLQIRSSNSIIGYRSSFMQKYIEHKFSLIGKKIYTKHGRELDERIDSDGNLRTRHLVYSKQVKLAIKPSFYKVLKKANSNSHIYEERDPELSTALRYFLKRRKNEL